ncbi:MAG: hypothetical protein GF317_15245 [Candidatus Lokiarchaeota archaeon]|nr:hypothetical protein [Candidatus Lokiarchaeota archaeon]MBD3200930.1 hypothetical protein [Candidatus Lokiarchaeota archaeon]
MNKSKPILDVCIIGSGYAGLNAARILSSHKIKAEIYSSGYGASQLWAGTFDFLNLDNFKHEKIQNQLEILKDLSPLHPYRNLEYDRVKESFINFSKEFPMIDLFIKDGEFMNKNVLTLIGNLKPCLGVWKTVFNEFESLKPNRIVILVDFIEFNNTSMYLVKKSLEVKFLCEVIIIEISFFELTTLCIDERENTYLNSRLSETRIGRFFDKHCKDLKIFSDFIITILSKKMENSQIPKIEAYLFPPILGLENNIEIIDQLTGLLKKPCRELVALSPSLLSRRLENSFKEILEERNFKIHKPFTLIDIEFNSCQSRKIWILTFKKRNEMEVKVKAKNILIATGSLFSTGCLESSDLMKKTFNKINIDLSNQPTNNFELVHRNSDKSHIYLCGSSIYFFNEDLTDEDEIKFFTGLGLAITTSYNVANFIIKSK